MELFPTNISMEQKMFKRANSAMLFIFQPLVKLMILQNFLVLLHSVI